MEQSKKKTCIGKKEPRADDAENPTHRSPADVTERVDRLIKNIRERWQAPVIGKPRDEVCQGDVLIVAHGHILRAFAMRWVGKKLEDGPALLLEAGGVGILR